MLFDYYAHLSEKGKCPGRVDGLGLTSGFVDKCTVLLNRDKDRARRCYMQRAGYQSDTNLELPKSLDLEPDLSNMPENGWFALDVSFGLKSPWYSQDDRPYHVLDNPVRKDRVFGVPLMSAASWKGLLRWTWRRQAESPCYLSANGMTADMLRALAIHLFGNDKQENESIRSGTLIFFPTWFTCIGFEIINPQSRSKRAGTMPIYYEVVPPRSKGSFKLLYAPMLAGGSSNELQPAEFVGILIDSIKALLETYGFSAKRSSGWGAGEIVRWKGFIKGHPSVDTSDNTASFKREMRLLLKQVGGGK